MSAPESGAAFDADVIVIGAGPAGSTVSHLLAKQGAKVRVFDKAVFPRFHVGESLLPSDVPLFGRLGFEPGADAYLRKAGAEFVDERSGGFADYPFCEGLPGTPGHAWHVERARFDDELAQLAIAAGADIRFGVKVSDATIGADEVSVVVDDETVRARYLIDATGQDAFLARRHKWVTPVKDFGAVAAFMHFSGLADDVVAEMAETGNIKILMHDDGWAWVIPLRGKRLSFGVVTRRRGQGVGIVDDVLAKSPLLQRLTRGAERTEPRLIRHFGYINSEAYGARYACVGDSAAFLDPVFSSGITLGMQAAEAVADTLAPALLRGDEADADLMAPVKEKMRHAYVVFGSLIKSFYHTHLVRHFFFHEDPDPRLRAGLITILAGDIFREDNDFQNSITKGRRLWTPEGVLAQTSP